MNQKEFNKYSKKIQAEVNKTLNNYDGLMAMVRSGEINEDNWSHTEWLNEVWTAKAYIQGLDEALSILAKQSNLEYKALDMKEIDDRLC